MSNQLQRDPSPLKAQSEMLPGMAMIAIYMLVVAMFGGFGAITGHYPGGKYVILPICSLIVLGVFGFLRMRRWGWALVTGGCLVMSLQYIYLSHANHNAALLVMAGLDLCFFLYLSRTTVRERLR